MENWKALIFGIIWTTGTIGTFIYLTFFDGFVYNAWNWIIAIPLNGFLASMWPIYWLILHWIF